MKKKYVYSKNPFIEKHMPVWLILLASPLMAVAFCALLLLIWILAIPMTIAFFIFMFWMLVFGYGKSGASKP